MSIPTHNLYDFVHQVTEKKLHLYYFYPWGEKDIKNIIAYFDKNILLSVENAVRANTNQPFLDKYIPRECQDFVNLYRFSLVCIAHDQEPLDFNNYKNDYISDSMLKETESLLGGLPENFNLRHIRPTSYLKHFILLHSELNSQEVEKYKNTDYFKCAFWWSHAVISRDWFRFAQHDLSLNESKPYKKLFLIYARDISGTRKYRKKFLNKLQNNKLIDNCQIGSFNQENITSNSSAEYNSFDIVNTAFSVVLETIFDNRIHLTEKTCRALACGHPFLLTNGPGSLNFLKKYGFKTFSPWINESYDQQQNDKIRMQMIIDEMNRLNNLNDEDLYTVIENCRQIGEHNKQVFFSDDFFVEVVTELKTNINNSIIQSEYKIDCTLLWQLLKYKKTKDSKVFYSTSWQKQRKILVTYLRHLKKGGTLEDYVPPKLD